LRGTTAVVDHRQEAEAAEALERFMQGGKP
jgi:hypothetical protein